LEAVELPDENAVASFRSEIEAKRYSIDPFIVVAAPDWQEGEGDDDGAQDESRLALPAQIDQSRLLLEAKRNKTAKTFQVLKQRFCMHLILSDAEFLMLNVL